MWLIVQPALNFVQMVKKIVHNLDKFSIILTIHQIFPAVRLVRTTASDIHGNRLR